MFLKYGYAAIVWILETIQTAEALYAVNKSKDKFVCFDSTSKHAYLIQIYAMQYLCYAICNYGYVKFVMLYCLLIWNANVVLL